MTATLKPFDLTHVQFVLLACSWWLGRNGPPPKQVQVAAEAGIEVKMASEVLRRLESKRLIERQRDDVDTRAMLITTTTKGSTLAAKAIAAVEKADADFFDGSTNSDFFRVLERLADG